MNNETFRDLKIKQVYLDTGDQKVFFCKHIKTEETYLVNAIFNKKPFELVDLDRLNNIIHCYEDFYEDDEAKYLVIKSKSSFGIVDYLEEHILSREQKLQYTDFILENLIDLKFLPIHTLCSLFNYQNIIIDLEDEISFLGLIVFEKNYLDLDLSSLLNNLADIFTDFHKDAETKLIPKEIKTIIKKCRERQYINYGMIKKDFDEYSSIVRKDIRKEIQLEEKKDRKQKKIQMERKNIRSVFNNSEKSLNETAKEEEVVTEIVEIEIEEPKDVVKIKEIAQETINDETQEVEDVDKKKEYEDVYSKLQQNAYKESYFEDGNPTSFVKLQKEFSSNDEVKEALVDEFFNAVEGKQFEDFKEQEIVKVKESLLNIKTIVVFVSVTIAMLLVLYGIYNFILNAEIPVKSDTLDTLIDTELPSNDETVLKTKELAIEAKQQKSSIDEKSIDVIDEISKIIKGDDLEQFYGGALLKEANPTNIPQTDTEEVYKGTHSFKLINETDTKKEFYVGGISKESSETDNNGSEIKFWLKSDKEQNVTISVVATTEGRTAPVRVWRPAYLTTNGWMQYSIEINQFEKAQLYISTAVNSNVWIDNYEINYK